MPPLEENVPDVSTSEDGISSQLMKYVSSQYSQADEQIEGLKMAVDNIQPIKRSRDDVEDGDEGELHAKKSLVYPPPLPDSP